VAAFIAARRAEHHVLVALADRAREVSPAWFYKWRDGDSSLRRAHRAALAAMVVALFAPHRGTYGSPRITADLHELGWRVSANTVAAVMAEHQLAARHRRRRGSTRSGKGRWRVPDLVSRNFRADDRSVPPRSSCRSPACSTCALRRIVGFALGDHSDAGLAYAALAMAVAVRGEAVPGVVLHTDGGSELTAGAFRAACDRQGIRQSMGRPSSALDNRGHRVLALHPDLRAARPRSGAAGGVQRPGPAEAGSTGGAGVQSR
jgi:putative transposase